MRTKCRKLMAMAVPVALAVFQACAGEAPTAPSPGELSPATPQPHMFVAQLDEIVMDDPTQAGPKVNAANARLAAFFQEENEFEFTVVANIPNPGDVLFSSGKVVGPGDDIIVDLDGGCRSCPIVTLQGSAVVGSDVYTQLSQNAEEFSAVVFFDGGFLRGEFGPPIPEEAE